MAAIKLLAVLSLDGYMVEASGGNPNYPATLQDGIASLKFQANYLLDENSSITLIREWKKSDEHSATYLLEAGRKSMSLLNCMMHMRLFDEIILYILPEFAGKGQRLFHPNLPELQWVCSEMKGCEEGIIRLTYRLRKDDKQTAMFSF